MEAEQAKETGTSSKPVEPKRATLAAVEIAGGDEEGSWHGAEGVGDAAAEEELGEEALVTVESQEAGREGVVEPVHLLQKAEIRGLGRD
ncbi:MAG: hypothetical protein R3B70_23760 [Polyangiaceae bacterium]